MVTPEHAIKVHAHATPYASTRKILFHAGTPLHNNMFRILASHRHLSSLDKRLTFPQPDTSTETCASPRCAQPFSFFARRHHCRRCGNIFCSSHTPHAVPLDQEARFHPEGSPQRSCDKCYDDYRAWRASRTSRTNSVISRGSQETASMPVGVPILRDGADETNQQNAAGSVAQSFGYSQWSTF